MEKLRVFISSTMKDMVNERDAVARRLREFNFEPIIAEEWLPGIGSIWDRIAGEIRRSDLFVLIVGERYGWIPGAGPKSEPGLSVTHLEVLEAKELQLPILAFFKEIPGDAKLKRQDKAGLKMLSDLVSTWEHGAITARFDYAYDLANKIGESIINVLTEDFQKNRKLVGKVQPAAAAHPALAAAALPPRLLDLVRERQVVLFVGAGISLAAGLPSAAFFAQRLIQLMRERFPDYEASTVSSAFSGIATDVEGLPAGRAGLLNAVVGLVRPQHGVEPTDAHRNAVRVFDQIITTNYDALFEDADLAGDTPHEIISAEIATDRLPERVIVNLHGSVKQPDSLVLNEREVLLLDQQRPRLWKAVRELLAGKTVIVVGSSLRDPSIVRLFSEAGRGVSGYFVVPAYHQTTATRLRAWNLECIQADAEGFFGLLAEQMVSGQ